MVSARQKVFRELHAEVVDDYWDGDDGEEHWSQASECMKKLQADERRE